MARTGCLCADDVCRLEPFWSLQQIKLHRLALIQRTVSVFLDGGEMHEHILSGGALDKTIALSPVEPFYCSFLSHKKLLSTLLCDLNLRSSVKRVLRITPSKNTEVQRSEFRLLRNQRTHERLLSSVPPAETAAQSYGACHEDAGLTLWTRNHGPELPDISTGDYSSEHKIIFMKTFAGKRRIVLPSNFSAAPS